MFDLHSFSCISAYDFLNISLQMFYETAKSCVQVAFGACNVEGGNQVFQDNILLLDRNSISRALSSCLDDLSNKGLHLLATTVAGGSVEFEKTRWKMKKIIREYLPKVFGSQNNHDDQLDISKQLSQLLNDPQNFRDNFITVLSSRSQSHRLAVTTVLDGLRDLPSETLIAMHRKLKGGQQYLPQLQTHKSGWNRDILIGQLRKTCEKMLSELGRGDELQGPLAKAMAVVGLSLKLQLGFHNSTVTEFHQFSPEIKILQDDIARAIWLVKTKVRIPDLKNLKTLLDRDAKVSNRSLRTAIKKMLTEYLFECGDMDTIPKSLLEALVIINKKSQNKLHRPIPKDEIEEEVECTLNVSAQAKQIVWDMFPDHDLDLDFADAYIEEMEGNEDEDDGKDDGDDDNNHNNGWPQEHRISGSDRSHSDDSHYEVESTGESRPFICNLPTATTTRSDCNPLGNSSVFIEEPETMFSNQGICVDSNDIKRGFHGNSIERHEPDCNTGLDTEDPLHVEPEGVYKQTTYKNQYLAIQEVSDETSMIAHNIVGHMLEAFAQIEGLDLDWDDSLYLRGDCATQEDSQGIWTILFFFFFFFILLFK